VDDGIDVVERRPDRLQVGDVRNMARKLLRRQRPRSQLVSPAQVLPQR
jgi:hypothetical protein